MRIVKVVSAFALAVVMVSMTACGGGGASSLSASSSDTVSSSTTESSTTATSDSVSSESAAAPIEYDGDVSDFLGMTEDELIAEIGEPTRRSNLFLSYGEMKISIEDGIVGRVSVKQGSNSIWGYDVPVLGVFLGDSKAATVEKFDNMDTANRATWSEETPAYGINRNYLKNTDLGSLFLFSSFSGSDEIASLTLNLST